MSKILITLVPELGAANEPAQFVTLRGECTHLTSQIALRKLRETQIVYYECITNRHQHGAEFLQQAAAEILFAIRSSQALAK